jgi:hypothetical protein
VRNIWESSLYPLTLPALRSLILVSAGEDYVGACAPPYNTPSPIEGLPDDLPPPTVRVIAALSEIDPQARAQLFATATRLPGVLTAVGMPDLHPGSSAGFPVGATIVSHPLVIYPPLIGGDIGCGLALYRTHIRAPAEGQAGLPASRKLAGKTERVSVKTWLNDARVSENSISHPAFQIIMQAWVPLEEAIISLSFKPCMIYGTCKSLLTVITPFSDPKSLDLNNPLPPWLLIPYHSFFWSIVVLEVWVKASLPRLNRKPRGERSRLWRELPSLMLT